MTTVNYADLVGQAEEVEDFSPLPPSNYEVVVDSAEVRQTKTGKVMYSLTLKVLSGEYKGRKLWANLVVSPESPQALGFFFRDMAALGADREFFSGGPSEADVCARIIDSEAVARVDVQKNDKTRNDVKGFTPSSSSPVDKPRAAAEPPTSPF